jgi:hypothetical protein
MTPAEGHQLELDTRRWLEEERDWQIQLNRDPAYHLWLDSLSSPPQKRFWQHCVDRIRSATSRVSSMFLSRQYDPFETSTGVSSSKRGSKRDST